MIGKEFTSIRSASIAQVGSKVVNVVMQLAITMVLARLISPAEFGVVAILIVFSSFFSILADAGISTAIAQFQDLRDEDYQRMFFLSLLIGIALSVLFFGLSFGIAWFYHDSIYVPLGAVMTLAVMCNALNMVPNGVLIKERKFGLIGMRLVVCTLVVGIAVIFMAFAGWGCYAVALNTVLTSLFVLIWNLSTSHLKMSVGDVRPIARKVGGFSLYQFGHEAIAWLSGNADSLLAGKMFGSEALGYYNKAYQLYGSPINILTAPITSTLIPFFAPLQKNVPALRAKFLGVMSKVSFICSLCTVGMSVCAPEIIQILFGSVWAPAAPLLQVLALAIYARGVNGVHAPLLSAASRPDLLMRSTLINTMVTLGMIVLGGVLGSVYTLAICVAIAYNCEILLPVHYCSKYCINMKSTSYFAGYLLPDITIAIIALFICEYAHINIQNVFLSLFVKAIVILAIMCVLKICWMKMQDLLGRLCHSGISGRRNGD